MENLNIIEHNCQTGKIVKRELTADEVKQADKDKTEHQNELAKIEELAIKKAKLLERLGISANEAKILFA